MVIKRHKNMSKYQNLLNKTSFFAKVAQAQLNEQLAGSVLSAISDFKSWTFRGMIDKFIGTSQSHAAGEWLDKSGLSNLEAALDAITSAIESKNVETIKTSLASFNALNIQKNIIPLSKSESWTTLKNSLNNFSQSLA